jgi:hypothetical protein
MASAGKNTLRDDVQLAGGFAPVRAYEGPFTLLSWAIAVCISFWLVSVLDVWHILSGLARAMATDLTLAYEYARGPMLQQANSVFWQSDPGQMLWWAVGGDTYTAPAAPPSRGESWTTSQMFLSAVTALLVLDKIADRVRYYRSPPMPPVRTVISPQPLLAEHGRCTCTGGGSKLCKRCVCQTRHKRFCSARCVCKGNCANQAPQSLSPLTADDICGLGEPHILTFIGMPKSGKSFALRALLYEFHQRRFFSFGIAMVGTGFTGAYDYLPDVWEFDEERLYEHVQEMRARKETRPNFIILDDLMGRLDVNSKEFTHFISTFRHTSTWVFITAQMLTRGTPTTLRYCTDGAFLFRSMGPQLKLFHEYWGLGVGSFDAWQQQFELTTVQHTAWVYLRGGDPTYRSFKAAHAPANFKMTFAAAPLSPPSSPSSDSSDSITTVSSTSRRSRNGASQLRKAIARVRRPNNVASESDDEII